MHISHQDLVMRGCKWLQNSQQCPVVLYEARGNYENPDVIGWRYHGHISVLLECKTSYKDFKKDFDKKARKLQGMGNFRYFFAPKGVIPVEEVPIGWGLLEVDHYVKIILKATEFKEVFKKDEMGLMYTALHRQSDNIKKINGFLSNIWPLRGHFNGALAITEEKEEIPDAEYYV